MLIILNLNIDIGANLTDPMYKGIYNGKKKHKEDLEDVLERSWKNNIKKIIITSGSLDDSIETLNIASLSGRYQYYLILILHIINLNIYYRTPLLYCWMSSNTL